MEKGRLFCFLLILLFSQAALAADDTATSKPPSAPATDDSGTPITEIIRAFAGKAHKHVVIDPRVRGNVLAPGVDLRAPSYRDLQAVLRLYAFVAIEIDSVVSIIPDANVRSEPLPVLQKDSSEFGPDEVFVKVLDTGKLDAAALVPILRTMLPTYANLAAERSTNSLLIVARLANIKTIEALIRELQKRPTVSAGSAESLEKK